MKLNCSLSRGVLILSSNRKGGRGGELGVGAEYMAVASANTDLNVARHYSNYSICVFLTTLWGRWYYDSDQQMCKHREVTELA